MGRYSLPSAFELWKRHECIYIEVFSLALRKFAESQCDISHEDIISEALNPILNEICFKVGREKHCDISKPAWEQPLQPIRETELKGGKQGKRPDFTCSLVNPYALSADEHEVHLHVECKRLGEPTSRTWILNEQYVINGIMRFDSSEHEYGKRALSGLMIGYIVSMSPLEILSEVNAHQKKYCADNPEIEYQLTINDVYQHYQRLSRKNVKPSDFGLFHLWIDLRSPLNVGEKQK